MNSRIIHPGRPSRLDIELDLMPTDRIFQRWARSVGAGIPAEQWSDTHTQASELPPGAAIFVDQYICHSPHQVRQFLHAWYRGQDPSAEIARRFGFSREGVYLHWRAVLWSAKAVFERTDCVHVLMQKHLQTLEAA